MKNIKFINSSSEIELPADWVESEKFHGFGRIINHGKGINGRTYRLISKIERGYSTFERSIRLILGILSVVSSLGLALISSSVKGFFTDRKKTIHFAIPFSSELESTGVSSLQLPDNLDAKILEYMDEVINDKDSDGVTYYNSQGDHRVFELSSVPGIIFKVMPNPSERKHTMHARYDSILKAQKICREYGLEKLAIPPSSLFTLRYNDKQYDVLAEKKLDIDTDESIQEQIYYEYADDLTEAISQLAIFICKTGYSDVVWRNNPVLNSHADEAPRKIALIDLEEVGDASTGLWGNIDPFRRGLIGCINEEQAVIIHRIAKWNEISTVEYSRSLKSRREELDTNDQLQRFYDANHIVAGDEQIDVDILDTLDLDLSEEAEYRKPVYDTGTLRSKRVKVTLREVGKEIINSINTSIDRNSNNSSIKRKRRIYLDMNEGTLKYYARIGLPQARVFPSEDEKKEKWPRKILQALVDHGHAFELLHDFGNEYVVQL